MGEHHENSLLRPDNSTNSDAVLLALETQFVTIAAELDRNINCLRRELADEAQLKEDEDVLARLAPIEQAIMETPAYTITGLSVKARHVAHVLSEYWEVPLDQIDWEGRAVRLLVEAICSVARTPPLLRDVRVQK
jgi:hypothetical protein